MTSRLDWDKDKMLAKPSPGAGKGDSPRNVGPQFARNFDAIRWSPKSRDKRGLPRPGRFKKVYR